MGVVGSLGGVVIANSSSARQAELQRAIELESKVVDQRITLIDRAAKVFGKSPGLQDLWERYRESLEAKGHSAKVPTELIEKLADAQGEFQSVLFLSQAYFGPRTKGAVSELSAAEGPWWQKPKAKQDALIEAMLSETAYGLSASPALGGKRTP